jgi:hypothetical protein
MRPDRPQIVHRTNGLSDPAQSAVFTAAPKKRDLQRNPTPQRTTQDFPDTDREPVSTAPPRRDPQAAVVVFDPATVRDTATYTNPHQYPEGIPFVIVSGAVAVDGGKLTAARAGRVLRRK